MLQRTIPQFILPFIKKNDAGDHLFDQKGLIIDKTAHCVSLTQHLRYTLRVDYYCCTIMNYYQLENKAMDEQFLSSRSVRCRVAIAAKDVLQQDQELIVMLSTGAKYKGKITVVDVVAIGNRAIGEIEIMRLTR